LIIHEINWWDLRGPSFNRCKQPPFFSWIVLYTPPIACLLPPPLSWLPPPSSLNHVYKLAVFILNVEWVSKPLSGLSVCMSVCLVAAPCRCVSVSKVGVSVYDDRRVCMLLLISMPDMILSAQTTFKTTIPFFAGHGF